jgi:hypothetical protein
MPTSKTRNPRKVPRTHSVPVFTVANPEAPVRIEEIRALARLLLSSVPKEEPVTSVENRGTNEERAKCALLSM